MRPVPFAFFFLLSFRTWSHPFRIGSFIQVRATYQKGKPWGIEREWGKRTLGHKMPYVCPVRKTSTSHHAICLGLLVRILGCVHPRIRYVSLVMKVHARRTHRSPSSEILNVGAITFVMKDVQNGSWDVGLCIAGLTGGVWMSVFHQPFVGCFHSLHLMLDRRHYCIVMHQRCML